MGSSRSPSCFISYSWDSPEHREWVRRLATELRNNGVDAILDVFHAPLGTDLTAFMAKIAQCDYVVLVCTPEFHAKSQRGPSSGVSYEQAIITGQIFTGAARPERFLPLLRAGRPAESLPPFLLNRNYADFTDDARFGEGLEELLRAIYETPQHSIPPLGPRPGFASGGVPAPLSAVGILFFEGFDIADDDPKAAERNYLATWTIGQDGPWFGRIEGGKYRLTNASATQDVRYHYIGWNKDDGGLDDLSDTRASCEVAISEANTGPFTSAGLLFRFDRARRFYCGFVVSRQVVGTVSRGHLQLIRRDERGFALQPLGAPTGFDVSRPIVLAIAGRGDSLDLSVDDQLFRTVPAPMGLRGDPGLIVCGTGAFEFDNFTIAKVD